jgi:tRNA-specific 2-thiouridylase
MQTLKSKIDPVRLRTRNVARVVVGLSGGVDSSVAALLLTRLAHQVSGLFMKNWEDDDEGGHCTAAEDLADTRDVCERLEIPLYKVNFAEDYRERVFRHFLDECRANRTPNPDVLCNREIKFKRFLEYALSLGAEYIATGHYARVDDRDGRYRLLKALDGQKDQTYFLYTLGQYELARTLFPVGELPKPEVRVLAAQAGFRNHGKKDSTGICFIGERRFPEFLGRYLSRAPGEIRTPEGETVGTHRGLAFYTLGQREGLRIGGRRRGSGAPWYVADKDPERNILVVVQGHDHPLLYARTLEADALHWVAGEPPDLPLHCRAKIRYRQGEQDCIVEPAQEGGLRVRFEQPQRAVTPGQSVVFYLGEECLGGGIIQHTLRDHARPA